MKRVLSLLILLASVQAMGQDPTPESTPEPRVTPTPDPNRPAGFTEDAGGLFVSAANAPEDYHQDRHRGTVVYDSARSNYSFHRVILPPGPLTITGANFSQALAGTVVFWRVRDTGPSSTVGGVGNRDLLTPTGRTVVNADIGCVVRALPSPGFIRGRYQIVGRSGAAWRLDRNVGAANASGAQWALVCPVRDFRNIAFEDCNLQNVWIPASTFRPTLSSSNVTQADMPEPEATP